MARFSRASAAARISPCSFCQQFFTGRESVWRWQASFLQTFHQVADVFLASESRGDLFIRF
jgi:hypothetical protein